MQQKMNEKKQEEKCPRKASGGLNRLTRGAESAAARGEFRHRKGQCSRLLRITYYRREVYTDIME